MDPKLDVQIVTAPSILGLKPGGVEKLPEALLSVGLLEKLNSQSPLIEVPTLNHLYSYEREPGTVLNTLPLRRLSESLGKTILKIDSSEKFTLVLGGDCSILIGIMSALKSKGTFGLFFLDAHADFYEPERSITGEAADMDLAIVTGRGPEILTDIANAKPYVRDKNVIHIGQRDMEETIRYRSQEIRETQIKCIDIERLRQHDFTQIAQEIKAYSNTMNVDGYWIHFDTDVIRDDENPAVDYRLPGGLSFQQCEAILKWLIQTHVVVGMSVTIFNPNLDPDGRVSEQVVSLITKVLG